MEMRPPSGAAVRAAQALRAFGPEYKRWIESRLPADAGMTSARLQALAALAEQGPMTMVALSRRLGTTPHNVTKLADWLEDEGFVVRRPDPEDRRAVRLEVTAKGDETQRQLAQTHLEAVAAAFTELEDEQLDHLSALLDRLRAAMRSRMD